MALRDKLRRRSEQYLEPGEQIQAVFMSLTGPSPYWAFLSYLIWFWTKNYVFVVTDRRILVLRAGIWTPSFPKHVELVLPRAIRMGPMSGLYGSFEQGGRKFHVHKRFHKDVAAADAQVSAAASPLPPPRDQPRQPPAPPQPAFAQSPDFQQPAPQPQPPQPAGWYSDPHRQARLRWWDGSAWSGHVHN